MSADLQAVYDAALAALSPRQRRFVGEYLRDLNGKHAAIRAGYSIKTAEVQASQTLRILKVRQAVDAGLALHAMPAGEVLARLADHARSSLADFFFIGEEKVTISSVILTEWVPDSEGGDQEDEDDELPPPPRRRRRTARMVLRTETAMRPVARLDLRMAAAAGKLHLIKKYSNTHRGEMIELYDAHAAQVKLGEHHGLFKAGDDILKYIDLSKLTPDQLRRIAEGESPVAVLLSNPTPGQS